MLKQKIIDKVLTLPPTDRAALAEKILASLDQPDPAIDELWAKEAENRIDAYEAGQIESTTAEQVFSKHDK